MRAVLMLSLLAACAVGAVVGHSNCERPVAARPAVIRLPAELVSLSHQYTFPPFQYSNGMRTMLHRSAMPEHVVAQMLHDVWRAFGASEAEATDFVAKNMAQARRESGLVPNILQGHLGDVNDDNPAGGLFQFIPATYLHWAVKTEPETEANRFNPLSNILAAINAQVNAKCVYTNCGDRVLAGCSGWGPSNSVNPYPVPGSVPSCIHEGQQGTCISVSNCKGTFHSGHCKGPHDIRCCVPKPPAPAGAAVPPVPAPPPPHRAAPAANAPAAGALQPVGAGIFAGSAAGVPASVPGVPAPNSPPPSSSPPPAPKCLVNGVSGLCVATSLCHGISTPGRCPGSHHIQCCTQREATQAAAWLGRPCQANGVAGECMVTTSCTGQTHRGLCPGPLTVQCCTPSLQLSNLPANVAGSAVA